MFSFSVPSVGSARIPAATEEIHKAPIDELLKNALEARDRGDYEGALALLKEAAEVDPANLDVGFYTGLTLYNLGKFEEAETKLRDVLTKAPLYVDVKIILGRVLIALGKLPESEKLLREAIAQTPDYMDAYDALSSNLLAQKKDDEAIFIIDLGLARKPEEVSLLVKKGKIFFVRKDYKKAREVADALTGNLEIQGRYQGHVLLGKIALIEDPTTLDTPKAELEEAINLDEIETEGYLVLTDIYVSFWKFKDARLLLDQAIDLVKDRTVIEKKQAEIDRLEKDVQKFTVNPYYSQWNFKDGRDPWKDFYLDAVWKIDPYKTLVFGVELFSRGGMKDQTLRVEYNEKINKWMYLYYSASVTPDADFREKNAFTVGANFVTNPLKMGSTVVVEEVETRNYDTGRIFFLKGGVDQYIGDSIVINARVFKVLSDTQNFNLWSVKTNWSLTPKLSVSANYGTMTEDISGRPLRGTTKGVGAQYRLNDRVSVTGNYQKVNNDMYRANQVTVGLKVSLGPKSSAPAKSFRAPEAPKKKRFFFF
jgi:YaiO family outer membrane protein